MVACGSGNENTSNKPINNNENTNSILLPPQVTQEDQESSTDLEQPVDPQTTIEDISIDEPSKDASIVEPINDASIVEPINDASIVEPINDASIVEPINDTSIAESSPNEALQTISPNVSVSEPTQAVIIPAEIVPPTPIPPPIPTGPAESFASATQLGEILDPNNIALSTLLNHSGRIGFGSKATGGLGGKECVVSSLDSVGPGTLRHCLENDDPLNVKFEVEGAIFSHHYILIGSNKTINGDNTNITITGNSGILCENSSNIIIHNIKFQGLNTGVRLRKGCDTIWLNHLQIDDISDEGIAIVDGATDITVSWTRINKTDKGILVGSGLSDTATKNSRVTLHHNVLSADQRNPNVRYAKVHMFSNLITNYKYEGTVASQLSKVRSERNAFVAGENAKYSTGLLATTHNTEDTESGLIWSFEDFFASNSYPDGNVQITSERIGFDIPYTYWAPPVDSAFIETLLNSTGWQP